MNILFIGDIVGRSGREALQRHLPVLKQTHDPDIVIVNGENAAHGKGINPKMIAEFYEWGVDVITTGNHVWDKREIIPYIANDPNVIRAVNFPPDTVGNGSVVFTCANGKKILVIHAMGRLFMDAMDDPFRGIDAVIKTHTMGRSVDAIFVDFHAEATSEKMALAHYLDGRVSAVVGTHTHIPTADDHILNGGTAYMSDVGMTGDYDSVIGTDKHTPIQKFITKMPGAKFTPASGDATLCAVLVKTGVNGLADSITPIRLGGTTLKQT